MGEATPHGVQHLLERASLDAVAARDVCVANVVEHLGHREGLLESWTRRASSRRESIAQACSASTAARPVTAERSIFARENDSFQVYGTGGILSKKRSRPAPAAQKDPRGLPVDFVHTRHRVMRNPGTHLCDWTVKTQGNAGDFTYTTLRLSSLSQV